MGEGGGGVHVARLNFKTSRVVVQKCLSLNLLSALPSLSQFGRGRLSLVAISFYALSLLFGPCRLSEFTLAGPRNSCYNFSSSIYAFQITLKLRTALKPWAENIKIDTITVQEYFKVLTCKACLSSRLQLWRDCGDSFSVEAAIFFRARGARNTSKIEKFPAFWRMRARDM